MILTELPLNTKSLTKYTNKDNPLGESLSSSSYQLSSLIKDILRAYFSSLIFSMETHASGSKVEIIIQNIRLDHFFVEEATRHFGGIWCLQDSSIWKVQILRSSKYHIHMKVNLRNFGNWLLIVVNWQPSVSVSSEFMGCLRDLASETNSAWAVIGDFNSILHQHEMRGDYDTPSMGGIPSFQPH